MSVYPKRYDKNDFLKYLKKNKASEEIINGVIALPESITKNGNTFKLDVNTAWYANDETHYTFELNYYSEELIEYLFNSKIFYSIEVSIKYLLCELINNNYIKD